MISLQRVKITVLSLLFAAGAIEPLLHQLILRTDHDGAAPRDPSAKKRKTPRLVGVSPAKGVVFKWACHQRTGWLLTRRTNTHLRNCGRNEFHPGADCFNVKYNSNVLVVNGSNLTVPNFLLSSGPSPSKLM